MNHRPHLKMGTLAAVIAVALGAGCRPPEGSGEHDGHGHEHAAEGHGAAHTENRNGVVLCTEHEVPEAECAVCQPDRVATLRPGESLRVRLPSTNSLGLVGVRTAAPETGAVAEAVDCVAAVSFNQNKLAQIAAPVSGIVQSVDTDLGARVEEQQTVATLWSATIAEAVAKAVLAHQVLDRERTLRDQRVTSEQALQEAEATHRAACHQLRTLGFTEAQIDELGRKPEDRVLMEVRAPFAGEIVQRTAVRGALVEAGQPLFTLVDASTVWAMLQVPEAALAQVRTGQRVELRVRSLPGQLFTGTLTWIGPAVDERTRMARARAEFDNPEGRLRDGMFATARILTRQVAKALLVPEAAVQRVEGRALVFVKQAEDLFEARVVALGATAEGRREVLAGLNPQEEIVVQRAFALKSAMLLSRLGAGCADD